MNENSRNENKKHMMRGDTGGEHRVMPRGKKDEKRYRRTRTKMERTDEHEGEQRLYADELMWG